MIYVFLYKIFANVAMLAYICQSCHTEREFCKKFSMIFRSSFNVSDCNDICQKFTAFGNIFTLTADLTADPLGGLQNE